MRKPPIYRRGKRAVVRILCKVASDK